MSIIQHEATAELGPEHAGILMTPEEFDAIDNCDDTWRYELIHGVLVVSPLPARSETGPNEELGRRLLNYRDQHPQGKALDLTLPEQIVRTREGRRRADRLIWTGLGRMPSHLETPTIGVEFVSRHKADRHRDYVEKRQEYMEVGMSEYWIFDRFQRIMTVLRNSPTGVQEIVIGERETYRTPLLPGFELPLAELLRVADALAETAA